MGWSPGGEAQFRPLPRDTARLRGALRWKLWGGARNPNCPEHARNRPQPTIRYSPGFRLRHQNDSQQLWKGTRSEAQMLDVATPRANTGKRQFLGGQAGDAQEHELGVLAELLHARELGPRDASTRKPDYRQTLKTKAHTKSTRLGRGSASLQPHLPQGNSLGLVRNAEGGPKPGGTFDEHKNKMADLECVQRLRKQTWVARM